MIGPEQPAPENAETNVAWRSRLPLVLLLVMAIVLCALTPCGWLLLRPSSDEVARQMFHERQADYIAAAQQSIEEAQPPGTEIRVELPQQYADLTEDGSVIVYWDSELGQVAAFYTRRGPFLGPSHCLVYCEEDCDAQQLSEWRFDEAEGLGDGWFLTYNY